MGILRLRHTTNWTWGGWPLRLGRGLPSVSGIFDSWSCNASLFWVVALLLLGIGVLAPRPVTSQQRALEVEQSENLDVVLILDSSASMLQSDPSQLRVEGTDLFLSFLKSGDRVAVISFAESAKVLRHLTDFSVQVSKEISRELRGIESKGIFTDLLQAIESGKMLLAQEKRPQAKGLIVLLSDGKLDPDPRVMETSQAAEKLLRETVPDLRAAGVAVYTLAFSDQADREMLQQIALGSDGISWYTPNVETVHKSFADLFLAVKKPQMLPVSRRGISIDGDVNEATFYINHGGQATPFLLTPLGERIDHQTKKPDVKWFQGSQFDVVTIERPDVGVWVIAGIAEQEGFATVLTNLKLVSDWPNTVREDEKVPLQARLYEGSKPVTLPEMTGTAQFGFQIIPTDRVSEPVLTEFLGDLGEKGDVVARDGIFSAEVKPPPPGEYRLRVIVKSPTFEREQDMPFRVRPPWLQLRVVQGTMAELVPAAKGTHDHHGDSPEKADAHHHDDAPEDFIEVEVSPDAVTFKEHKVELLAMSGKNKKKTLGLLPVQGSDLRYRARARDLAPAVKYELRASVSLVPRRGRPIIATSLPLNYQWEGSHEADHEEETSEVPEQVHEEKVEPVKTEEAVSWTPFILISVLHLLLGSFVFIKGEALVGNQEEVLPELVMPTFVASLMEELRALSEKATVPLEGARPVAEGAGGASLVGTIGGAADQDDVGEDSP